MTGQRWDCIFVDRIDNTRRIYLTTPQEYGYMYRTIGDTINEAVRVRKSIPRDCGVIKGSSNEDKVFIATAIAIALNHDKIVTSNGLVVRGFVGGITAIFHRYQDIGKPFIHQKRKEGTTGWLVYISPGLELYYIDEDTRSIGERFPKEDEEKISDCVKHIFE